MSDSLVPSLNQLPLEILHGIFRCLGIPDILRIRRVSRYLNEVSHDRHVWSDAYRTADFVRPPGPFLSQSAGNLESALIPSFRAAQKLRSCGTSRRERPTLKLREIRYTGVDIYAGLVFGRFFVIAFREEVRCYDLNIDAFDSNSGASIIYRPTGGSLRSFHCVSAFDTEGCPFACAVLSEAMEILTTQISIYSLNVGQQSDVTPDLLYQFENDVFDIVAVDLGPRMIVIQGRDSSLPGDQHWRHITLDVHTRTQFILSSFICQAWEEITELPERRLVEELTPPTSISTSTHIFLARSFYTRADGWATFLQAFTLPSQHIHRPSTSIPLSPSHRGTIPGINMRGSILLHDAILDPTTQDILIAIRVHAYEPSRPRSPHSKHGILRLSSIPASHNHDSEAGTVAFQLLGSLGRLPWISFLHPSFNGTGRTFYTLDPGWWIISAVEYNLSADGGGQHQTKVIEYPSILTFPAPRTLLDYDPYFGRMCLRSAMAKYRVIEIFDLAV